MDQQLYLMTGGSDYLKKPTSCSFCVAVHTGEFLCKGRMGL